MPIDETAIADLEKQVDDMLKQLDDVLGKSLASPGEPHAEHEDQTGSAKDNTSGYRRRVKLHDNAATASMDKADKSEKPADGGGDDVLKQLQALQDKLDSALAKKKGEEEGDDDEDDWDFAEKAKKAAPAPDEGEAVVIDGQRIAKSEVGEAQFAIIKSMNERLSKASERIEKAEAEAEMEKLKKRADDSYSHVPGSTDERASMLKAMVGMPDPLRKSFEKVFEQSEKLAKTAFETKGFGKADIEGLQSSRQQFESKVSEIKKRENCSRTEALEKARKEDPDGFKAFQGQN